MKKAFIMCLISLVTGASLGANCPSGSSTPCKGKCLFRRELDFLGGSTDPDDMKDWLTHLDVGCYELNPDGTEVERTAYGLFADSFGAAIAGAVLYIGNPLMGELFDYDVVGGHIMESTANSGAIENEADIDNSTWNTIKTTAQGYAPPGTPHDYSLINYRCWEFAEDEYANY